VLEITSFLGDNMAIKTPLYDEHVALGGKIVDFAGYELPVQYSSGIIAEHTAVRERAGFFDVSHMGEFIISGVDAEKFLNYLLTNDFTGMEIGKIRYTLMCYENGGAVDDLLVYKLEDDKFLLVVNAANLEKDASWIKANIGGFKVKFENISEDVGLIAVQGPLSKVLLEKIASNLPEKYYTFIDNVTVSGVNCLISMTGYTGELGYEIYIPASETVKVYRDIVEKGKELDIIPCGLGARDTLRLEAGLPLYGHELGADILVNEVGLSFAIKMKKDDFIGKQALENHVPAYSRIGAFLVDRGIAREGATVYAGDEEVGVVTSGTHSPTLGRAIVVLRVKKEYIDSDLTVEVRGKKLKIEQTALPFYKASK